MQPVRDRANSGAGRHTEKPERIFRSKGNRERSGAGVGAIINYLGRVLEQPDCDFLIADLIALGSVFWSERSYAAVIGAVGHACPI